MSRQSNRDTAPEMAVRRELHRRGLRYRVHYRPERTIRSTPDITFTRARVVVFVDGCFWHQCPEHGTSPSHNSTWWLAKLSRNVERDRRTNEAFTELGWTVVRVWEHESATRAADRVSDAVTEKLGS